MARPNGKASRLAAALSALLLGDGACQITIQKDAAGHIRAILEAQPDPGDEEDGEDRPAGRRAGTYARIRNILEDAGHRLLLREIMDEFARRGWPESEKTVWRCLKSMPGVNNTQHEEPPGWGYS